MSTDIIHIDNSGDMHFVASYTLEPKEALKCAVMQFLRKNFNTWDYDKVDIPIKIGEKYYYYHFGDNETFVAKEAN